jgi:hypothetical protein
MVAGPAGQDRRGPSRLTALEDTMKTGAPRLFRRSIVLAAAGILAVVLTACTGRGGGQLPPSTGFTGPASFGFTFSCQDKGGLNPPTGRLRIQLSYTDHGSSPTIGSQFTIHGIVDEIPPVVESMICIGQNPPPDPPGNNVLTFLGRYRLTSSPPAGFPSPSACPTRATTTPPMCRFEVTVQDNDRNLAPSPGDFFSIKLSTVTASCTDPIPDPTCSQLPEVAVFYARAGTLSSGNLTVR